MTRGDKIRESIKTDEELADFMREYGIAENIYCCQKTKCEAYVDVPGGDPVPSEMCRECLIEWLKQESESEKMSESEKVSDSDTHWRESVMRTFLANH